jgi:hypothetical protein
VTNSTTEICKVKLLNGTKYKIIPTGLKAYGGVEVWFLSLNYNPVAGEWLTARPTTALFGSKHKPVPVNCTPHTFSVRFQTKTGTG